MIIIITANIVWYTRYMTVFPETFPQKAQRVPVAASALITPPPALVRRYNVCLSHIHMAWAYPAGCHVNTE